MKTKIRVANLINDSIVDGPGIRMTIFVQGCPHKCPGCHNEHTWDFNGGYEITLEEIYNEIKSNPLLDGVTISGGEPFLWIDKMIPLLEKIKEDGLNIISYTGYTYEKIKDIVQFKEVFQLLDYLIDGPFILDKRDLTLLYRGSSNQRIINISETLGKNEIVICETIS